MPAVHAAALERQLFESLKLGNACPAWQELVNDPTIRGGLVHSVHGALRVYDLPDLVAYAESSPIVVKQIAEAITKLESGVLTQEQREQFKDQTWQSLRARGDEANRRDVANWRTIKSRDDWERLREERLQRLRTALGAFPAKPLPLDVRLTKKIEGNGFVIQNLVYRTRAGLWVTANLYAPENVP